MYIGAVPPLRHEGAAERRPLLAQRGRGAGKTNK